MHHLKGRKQSPGHIAKRLRAMKGKPRSSGSGRPANTPEVLWSKVSQRGVDECWPWTGYVTKSGYGRTWIGDKGYYAHRVIYALANPGLIERNGPGDAHEDAFVMHTCDNPGCCNPNHLKVGTHQDNMDDKVSKNRQKKWGGGIRSPRAKLSAEDVQDIRIKKKAGATKNALALLYDVSVATISGACYGRHYQDVS